jgi:hypothetical protein
MQRVLFETAPKNLKLTGDGQECVQFLLATILFYDVPPLPFPGEISMDGLIYFR